MEDQEKEKDGSSIDEELYLHYLTDLSYIPRLRWIEQIMTNSLIKPSLEYIKFICDMTLHILLTFLTDFMIPISQPLNFTLMIIVFPITFLLLFPVNIIVKVCKVIFGNESESYKEDKWKSMIAKDDLEIREIVFNGKRALSSGIDGPKSFNLDMAETLLILCTIIYEQAIDKVREVHEKLKDHTGTDFSRLIDNCREACKQINKKAKDFGLNFVPLSELGCLDGLFAGMFWSEDQENENNFIVITFKGTSPTNFTEWLTDFLFMREDASQFVFGEIHKGFYKNFFPNALDGNKKSYPAQRMVETTRKLAEKIKKKNGKVNIWITGHSLGAALAQVFYARLIKIGALPECCELRDAYAFAGPAVGDKDFSSSFNGSIESKLGEHKTLWRIVNTNDIVTKMPPRHLYYRLRHYITKADILNYYPIGHEIQIFLDNNNKPKGIVLHEKDELGNKKLEDLLSKKIKDENSLNSNFGIDSYRDYDKRHLVTPSMSAFEFLLPKCFLNHLPHRYFMAMERLRSDKFELVVGDYYI